MKQLAVLLAFLDRLFSGARARRGELGAAGARLADRAAGRQGLERMDLKAAMKALKGPSPEHRADRGRSNRFCSRLGRCSGRCRAPGGWPG